MILTYLACFIGATVFILGPYLLIAYIEYRSFNSSIKKGKKIYAERIQKL